jgi:hypothetical protein
MLDGEPIKEFRRTATAGPCLQQIPNLP